MEDATKIDALTELENSIRRASNDFWNLPKSEKWGDFDGTRKEIINILLKKLQTAKENGVF